MKKSNDEKDYLVTREEMSKSKTTQGDLTWKT